MPGNLSAAAPSAVMPQGLATAFNESLEYPLLWNSYHDGTVHSSLIADGVNAPRPVRTWKLSRLLNTSQLAALQTFWETTVLGGLRPFYFYDPNQPATGQRVGSSYDPTGASAQGRVTVRFEGNWQHVTGIARHQVPKLMLVEIA